MKKVDIEKFLRNAENIKIIEAEMPQDLEVIGWDNEEYYYL